MFRNREGFKYLAMCSNSTFVTIVIMVKLYSFLAGVVVLIMMILGGSTKYLPQMIFIAGVYVANEVVILILDKIAKR